MVIDLGEPREELELSPRPWPPSQRRALGAVLMLAALLGAGGAAAPVRSDLVAVTIPATAADDFMIADDALYLTRPSRGVSRPGLRTITRYPLADATEPEWEARFYTSGPVGLASIVDGMLLAVADRPDFQTIALRVDTGREVWRRTGYLYPTGKGYGLLQDSRALTQQLFSVEVATGRVRWSLTYAADDPVLMDGDRFVHWTKTGTAQVHDSTTGAVLATAHLPVDSQMTAQVVGGLLLIRGAEAGRPVLTAYGLDSLDRRWQADIDPRNENVSGECGDGMCLNRPYGSGVRLIDLATGRTRWSARGWAYAQRVGPYLFAYGRSQTADAPTALLDTADGHVVREFGEWTASMPAENGQMLGVREKGSRALMGRLDVAKAEAEILGALTGVFQCQASPRVVACRRSGGSIGVWYPKRGLRR